MMKPPKNALTFPTVKAIASKPFLHQYFSKHCTCTCIVQRTTLTDMNTYMILQPWNVGQQDVHVLYACPLVMDLITGSDNSLITNIEQVDIEFLRTY